MNKRKRAVDWQRQDPDHDKEVQRYGQAAPSRAFLLQYLEQRGAPVTLEALVGELELDADWQVEALSRRLRAMEREGQVVRNRRDGYGVTSKMDLVAGRVIGHPEGFGFLVPDDSSGDLFLSPREMRALLHGDRALVRVAGIDHRGRREAAVVDVLERNTTRVVGRYQEQRDVAFVEPDNRRLSHQIAIPQNARAGARPGQIVVAEIVEQPGRHRPPIGRVKEVLGDHMAPGMEVQIAIVSHDIPVEWPPQALEEAAAFGDSVPTRASADRLDLRRLPLVTIDGITARDFDDAVYCERRGRNWRLLVAIADVSHYVRPGSALDQEAFRRGNSVYFPDRVIPMLPESLSNGLCSLNPQVDRLCLVCEMTIDPQGRILRSRYQKAVMRSAARLTYDAVGAILVDQDRRLRAEFSALVPHLENLHALYHALRTAREARGAIDFETQETEIEYGPERKIERIVPTQRHDAHRLIEECMIAANVAAARFLFRQRIPTLYRIHEGPKEEKLAKLREFLGELGLGLGGGDTPSAKDYALVLSRAQGRLDLHLIQTVMLRSLSQAVYSPDNVGHFGLALEGYAHFTSPIRRYPDLMVHRAITHLLDGGKAREFGFDHGRMQSIGEQCSMTERRADEATREAVEWLKCEFMMDKVGGTFDGIVTAVTSFGLFVELSGVYVEGLVHITALPNDYYHFEPAGHRLTGERGGRVFRLGDPLRVRVVRVDLDSRKIDFEPVDGGGSARRGRRRSAGRG